MILLSFDPNKNGNSIYLHFYLLVYYLSEAYNQISFLRINKVLLIYRIVSCIKVMVQVCNIYVPMAHLFIFQTSTLSEKRCVCV